MRAIDRALEHEKFAILGREQAPMAELETVALAHPMDYAEAIREAAEALANDPDSDDAAEITWRASRQMRAPRPPPAPAELRNRERVEALLARAAPGQPEGEARPALAELALIAPDDSRVADLPPERRRHACQRVEP